MKKLIEKIEKIHKDCNFLCIQAIGTYLKVAGNIGVFCQNEEEYRHFSELKNRISKSSNSPNQKYYELTNPITVKGNKHMPEAKYTHLYIRKPDPTPYGKYLGDIDFVLDLYSYDQLKKNVREGRLQKGIEIYNRKGWDTLQITNPKVNAVAYISTKEFAEKVRIKFD